MLKARIVFYVVRKIRTQKRRPPPYCPSLLKDLIIFKNTQKLFDI